eukprot:GHVS01079331.1.p1 GENE.GHVS01079331.1~~GHVS01079331.1.p1  ORF type:complete len:531 (+),score=88.60 GHVS01079331.1:32-1624(+)
MMPCLLLPSSSSSTFCFLSPPLRRSCLSSIGRNLSPHSVYPVSSYLSTLFASRHLTTSPPPAPPISSGAGGGAAYDVVIVGGGITGTSLLYSLAAFTDVKRVALLERRGEFAAVASHSHNNSQTIHCGDIETNYSISKATSVKRHADMLRNYATKLPPELRDKCVYKMPKMALAVGESECAFMEERFGVFRTVFKNMQWLGKQQIADVEPCVAMESTHRFREETINAIYISNEHSAVDYRNLAKSFVDQAADLASKHKDRKMDMRLHSEVDRIDKNDDGTFKITTTNTGVLQARYVVVSACGHSLVLAQRLGYGLQYSCLPMAGSFYFAPNVLHGKVYTVQNPKLPFAAVHGDPDISVKGKTRFGPTALPLPMLERYNNKTIKDFLEVLKPDMDLVAVYWDLFKVSTIRNYVLRNFMFEVPKLNKKIFVQDARKIIPSMRTEDLVYAKGFGGVRPQLVDKKQRKLLLGEGRIAPTDANIVFNITPSPGGTTCLGTAEMDTRAICKALGVQFHAKSFEETLLKGEYLVDYV